MDGFPGRSQCGLGVSPSGAPGVICRSLVSQQDLEGNPHERLALLGQTKAGIPVRVIRSQCGRHMPLSGDPPAAVARLGVSRHMLQVGTADGRCYPSGSRPSGVYKPGNPFGSSSWGKPPRPDCLTNALPPQRSGSPSRASGVH